MPVSYLFLLLLVSSSQVTSQCTGKADIIFAIPGSEIVPGQEFISFERFLINLIGYFQLSVDEVNVGLILYGKEPEPISWLQPFKSAKQTNTRITLMSQRVLYYDQLHGGNDVAAAITLVRHMFKNPSGNPTHTARSGAKHIGVFFTYDSVLKQDRQRVVDAANEAKIDGIVMYVVGKGRSGPEFASIGSDYCKTFSMGQFIDDLPSLLAYLGSSICSEMGANVNVTASNCFPQLYQRKESEPVQCTSLSHPFPDPDNCAYYYHCLYRRPVQVRCPVDMLFDPIANSCNYKQYVSCYTDITCPTKVGLFPHPNECNMYVNCFDHRPYVQSCPSGLWFNQKTGSCEAASLVACAVK